MMTPRALRAARLVRPAAAAPSSGAVPKPFAVSVPFAIPAGRQRLFSRTASRRSQNDPHDRLRNARPLVPDAIASRIGSAGRVKNPRAYMAAAVAAAVAFYLYNSQTVPVTGRRRFNFLSDRFVAWTHSGAAAEIIRQVQSQGGKFLSERDARTVLVKRVMRRLIPVSGMADLDWEIFVIADDGTANAFVLPGGKVFVHSGIINVCGSEDALAAVLGHEIAHNTASHAAERLSGAWVGNLTAGSLFFLAGALPGLALFTLWNLAGGFYLQELLYYLPMGRKQETEADYVGLMMMAEACYDPRRAVTFWQRMHAIQQKGGQEVPEMLSTHPSNEHRIVQIQKWLPEAMEKSSLSDCQGTAGLAHRFRGAIKKGTPWLGQ